MANLKASCVWYIWNLFSNCECLLPPQTASCFLNLQWYQQLMSLWPTHTHTHTHTHTVMGKHIMHLLADSWQGSYLIYLFKSYCSSGVMSRCPSLELGTNTSQEESMTELQVLHGRNNAFFLVPFLGFHYSLLWNIKHFIYISAEFIWGRENHVRFEMG